MTDPFSKFSDRTLVQAINRLRGTALQETERRLGALGLALKQDPAPGSPKAEETP